MSTSENHRSVMPYCLAHNLLAGNLVVAAREYARAVAAHEGTVILTERTTVQDMSPAEARFLNFVIGGAVEIAKAYTAADLMNDIHHKAHKTHDIPHEDEADDLLRSVFSNGEGT